LLVLFLASLSDRAPCFVTFPVCLHKTCLCAYLDSPSTLFLQGVFPLFHVSPHLMAPLDSVGCPDPVSSSRPLPTSSPSDTTGLDMKDTSVPATRQSRNSLIYPKKRPSPHGIHKVSKSPSLLASYACRSPRSAKLALLQQQQRLREAQFCRKESVLLEEEYRDEIRYYMHDMEVSSPF
jgi:hypothetical protein